MAAKVPQRSVKCSEVPQDCVYTCFAFLQTTAFPYDLLRGSKVSSQSKMYCGANPRRACAGGLRYLSCLSVCLSVCYHLIVDIVRFYGLTKVRTVLFSFVMRGFSREKNSVQKLWREKAQYANEQLLLTTGFSPFRVLCIHQ